MAIQTISQLKAWFQTGLKPLQQQFADWLDSFRHVSVKIGINDFTDDVKTVINNVSAGALKVIVTAPGAATYSMPAGAWVVGVLMLDDTNPSIAIGTTAGGIEVYDYLQLANGYNTDGGFAYFMANTIIYFTGITASTVIKILYV